MLDQTQLDFLRDLRQNNTREWFHANKQRYERELKGPFVAFIAALIKRLQQYDPAIQIEPQQAMYRIHRDVRFSKDKTPYNRHISAIISRYGRKNASYPGLYFRLDEGMLTFGGGVYYLEKTALEQLRQKISQEPQRLQQIVDEAAFRDKYGTIQGEQYKRIPVAYKELAQSQPLLANKQFYALHEMPSERILEQDLLDMAEEHFLAVRPLNRFLAEAIAPAD